MKINLINSCTHALILPLWGGLCSSSYKKKRWNCSRTCDFILYLYLNTQPSGHDSLRAASAQKVTACFGRISVWSVALGCSVTINTKKAAAHFTVPSLQYDYLWLIDRPWLFKEAHAPGILTAFQMCALMMPLQVPDFQTIDCKFGSVWEHTSPNPSLIEIHCTRQMGFKLLIEYTVFIINLTFTGQMFWTIYSLNSGPSKYTLRISLQRRRMGGCFSVKKGEGQMRTKLSGMWSDLIWSAELTQFEPGHKFWSGDWTSEPPVPKPGVDTFFLAGRGISDVSQLFMSSHLVISFT